MGVHIFAFSLYYMFGIANRELVAAGLRAGPHAPDRMFKGFIPTVYPFHVARGASWTAVHQSVIGG